MYLIPRSPGSAVSFATQLAAVSFRENTKHTVSIIQSACVVVLLWCDVLKFWRPRHISEERDNRCCWTQSRLFIITLLIRVLRHFAVYGPTRFWAQCFGFVHICSSKWRLVHCAQLKFAFRCCYTRDTNTQHSTQSQRGKRKVFPATITMTSRR